MSQLLLEDSCHYLLFSVIFLYSYPITLVLLPLSLFAFLHVSSNTLILLDKTGNRSCEFHTSCITNDYELTQRIMLRFSGHNPLRNHREAPKDNPPDGVYVRSGSDACSHPGSLQWHLFSTLSVCLLQVFIVSLRIKTQPIHPTDIQVIQTGFGATDVSSRMSCIRSEWPQVYY